MPGSSRVNVKLPVLSFVGSAGNVAIVVSGVDASMVQLCVSGLGSVLPAGSIARTSNVCGPLASVAVWNGVVQGANAPASTLHSNVEPTCVDVNWKSPVASVLGFASAAVIVVFGGAVSTVHVCESGVASMLPARSIARTRNVCEPSASAAVVNGVMHAANVAPSSEHWNIAAASLLVNVKSPVSSLVGFDGAVAIVVSGGAESTVHV